MTTLALADDRLAIRVQRLTGGVCRWLSILSESFSVRSVAAVALLRAGPDPEEGWLGRLAALSRTVPPYCLSICPVRPRWQTSSPAPCAPTSRTAARGLQ